MSLEIYNVWGPCIRCMES